FLPVVLKAASVLAGSRNSSASISAGRSIPAASSNRPASIHAGRHIPAGRFNKPAPSLAGRSVPTGIVDIECSRSMTGNKEKLDDFMLVKGGTVTFGGGDGKITGKCTIRTSKLNFENVYYVEELQHFNLFYVSQICNKKNKVLFTDDDSLVLTKEFQLPDKSQESTKWHRRMAHVNFKTINKLAKNGLVEGLPLKLFTNEHNCVACNKGKQHKASYKAISIVRTISEPLQLLHMDLFGPTSIGSIDQKYYSLVVTDDFSREKGIKRDYSNARTPQQNRVAERKNRTLIEAARSMLGTQDTNIHAGTQDDDSESECDEQAILVPSFPSNSFLVPKVNEVSATIENHLDYAEELARLHRQEHEAHSTVEKYGFEFSNKTTEMLHQAKIKTRRNLDLAAGDPAGSIVSTGGVPAGSVPTVSVPISSVPASSVPASSVPAASESVPAVFKPGHANNSTLPPCHSLGLTSSVVVDPFATKK
nr:hypothetical protein [Tanacetum cinerariifolium]